MARWALEDAFDATLRPIAARHGLDVALVKGLIGQESAFQAQAERFEPRGPGPADDDASRGLMQILYATAREVGYTGTPEGLFEPAVNLEYGCRYLAKQLGRAGSRAGGVSAYNGGWRPEWGFGRPAASGLTVCLAKNRAGVCIEERRVEPGEYANQPYVDRVLANAEYFAARELGAPPPAPGATDAERAGAGCLPVVLVLVVTLTVGALL